LASAFLTGFLVFLVSAAFSFIVTQSAHFVETNSTHLQIQFLQSPNLAFALVGASALAGLAAGTVTYLFLKRRHEARLRELSTLTREMRNEAQQANVASSHGVTDNALSLLDKIMMILPEIVRKRNQDSLLFGVVAFLVAAIVVHSLEISVVVGAMIWLYFRYETRKTYQREIRKLEEQGRVFEQRKKELVETLSALP
jgi:hypothetical protein